MSHFICNPLLPLAHPGIGDVVAHVTRASSVCTATQCFADEMDAFGVVATVRAESAALVAIAILITVAALGLLSTHPRSIKLL
jgi:hypothetical protein